MKSEVIYLYPEREDVTLTTYVLADSPEMLNQQKRPAVLICPGGAYLSCSDREAEPIAMKFASMGYHAFVLRYSVYGEGKPVWPNMGEQAQVKPHVQHPTPMREIGMAMLKIREHAADWLVDADRIAVCGFSAGAHNVSMFATNYHKPVITEFLHTTADQIRPAALITGYMLSDYIFMKEELKESKDPLSKILFEYSNTSFLGTHQPDDALLEEVSPARNVSEMTPPSFVWSTAADDLVPVQHSVLFANALAAKKIPFEIHIFEEGPHGLATATWASAGAMNEISPEAAEWMSLCETWLQKRFAVELPEKKIWG